jgi:hypothetical protein
MAGSANSRIAPENLMRAIRTKGLTFQQTAQLARRHLPAESRLSHTSVWSYATGRATPKRLSYIEAIEKAVGAEPDGLRNQMNEGSGSSQALHDENNVLAVKDLGEGLAHLEVQTVASWREALSVLALLCKNARKAR